MGDVPWTPGHDERRGTARTGEPVGLSSSPKLLCPLHEIFYPLQSLQLERVGHKGSLCATTSEKVWAEGQGPWLLWERAQEFRTPS